MRGGVRCARVVGSLPKLEPDTDKHEKFLEFHPNLRRPDR